MTLKALPRPAPGAAAALAAIYAALLGPFACSAKAQAPQWTYAPEGWANVATPRAATVQPGVGFKLAPGSSVCTEDSNSRNQRCVVVDLSARPFGPTGNDNAPDSVLLAKRYSGGDYPSTRQPIGQWADLQGANIGALVHWFSEQPEAHRAQWSGVPTNEEWYDLAHSQSRRGSRFYAEHWFSLLDGGRPETAKVVDEANYPQFAWLVDLRGWGLGLHSEPNTLGYPIYYRVEWLPGVVEPPPPPDPPPPPPEPACSPWQSSPWLEQCGRLALRVELELAGAELCSWCEPRGREGSVLAGLRAGVCSEGLCEEAEEPPPPPPPPPVETCPRFRVIVTPETFTMPRYNPGISSNGLMVIELVPMEEGGPCP